MHGHLDLVASQDSTGRTVLSRQSFSAPIHISKPHHDAGWLVVNLASPTPGLFAGDHVDVRVAVAPGARLLLTAPSANRIHTMTDGRAALAQRFTVAPGSVLDVLPEYLIPQAGARYRQETRIEVEQGGGLLWTETVAPGRTARGEVFAFTELQFATDVVVAGSHLLRERYRLVPPAGIAALTRHFPQAYYASILCVNGTEGAPACGLESMLELHDGVQCWVGATRLGASAVAVKVVAADSPTLRQVVGSARALLQEWMGLSSPQLRRITGAPVLA